MTVFSQRLFDGSNQSLPFVVQEMRRFTVAALDHEAGDAACCHAEGMLGGRGEIEGLVCVEECHEGSVDSEGGGRWGGCS